MTAPTPENIERILAAGAEYCLTKPLDESRLLALNAPQERERQVDSMEEGLLLLQLGCTAAQGYSIACPKPADELVAWMTTWDTPHVWSE